MSGKATFTECFHRYLPREGFSDKQIVKRYRLSQKSLYFTARVIEIKVRPTTRRNYAISILNRRATSDYTKIFCFWRLNPSAKQANVSNFLTPIQLAKPNPDGILQPRIFLLLSLFKIYNLNRHQDFYNKFMQLAQLVQKAWASLT